MMERIRKWSDVQEMNSLRYHLASAFCVHGSDHVARLPKFGEYKTLSGLDEEEAWKAIQEVAKGYNSTFQKYLTELEEYKEKYQDTNVISVGAESILVVDHDHNRKLRMWYLSMIGYDQKSKFGLMVCEGPSGSTKHQAMEQLGATFDTRLYAKAEESYNENKNLTNTRMGLSRQDLLGGLSLLG